MAGKRDQMRRSWLPSGRGWIAVSLLGALTATVSLALWSSSVSAAGKKPGKKKSHHEWCDPSWSDCGGGGSNDWHDEGNNWGSQYPGSSWSSVPQSSWPGSSVPPSSWPGSSVPPSSAPSSTTPTTQPTTTTPTGPTTTVQVTTTARVTTTTTGGGGGGGATTTTTGGGGGGGVTSTTTGEGGGGGASTSTVPGGESGGSSTTVSVPVSVERETEQRPGGGASGGAGAGSGGSGAPENLSLAATGVDPRLLSAIGGTMVALGALVLARREKALAAKR